MVAVARVRSFAEAVDDPVAVETRAELVRLAQHYLTEWERHRDPVTRGRLLQTLDDLALLLAGDD